MVESQFFYNANWQEVINLNDTTQIIDKDLKFIDFSSDENQFVGWKKSDSV
jgi:hypothetical protein